MINSIKIAFRNTLRNKRRTLLSVLAIAIGGFASLLIGSFVTSVNHGIQTGVARSSGHLHIHKKGYFDFGAGTVGAYDIEDYEQIIDSIEKSPLSKKIAVITPTLSLGGIAGNYAQNSSQTFVGIGMVADDQKKMQSWDGFGIGMPVDKTLASYHDGGLIGKGLAINLALCESLKIKGCKEKKAIINDAPIDEDIADFAMDEPKSNDGATLSLLAASSKGAPNIVRLPITKVWKQTNKEMDDRFIAMPLDQAQTLLYGNGIKKVNTINIQLKSPDDIDPIAEALEHFFTKNNLDLEVIKLHQFNPQIDKVIGMFSVIFAFVSVVIGLIAIFTVSNTMTMSIMERFNEIGTLRSMGLRRSGVRTYFLLEGSIIGIFGATLGVAFALLVTSIINSIGLMWSPPNVSEPTQLVFNLTDNIALIVGVWIFLVLISVISSILPAIRASKMPIVDALRHN